ncbi:hypothetical protein P4O66_016765, partial [Electrophorus voltai]
VDLLYWREVRKTGLVFTGLVVGLACLFQLSVITLLSNLGLGLMAFTLPLRLFYKAMELVRFCDAEHPFQSYLDEDSSLTDEDTIRVVEKIVLLIATLITELKRLFFIDSIVDSLKERIDKFIKAVKSLVDKTKELIEIVVMLAKPAPRPASGPKPKLKSK